MRVVSSLKRDLVTGARIALAELRAQFRRSASSPLEEMLVGLGVVLFALGALVSLRVGYAVGAATGSGTETPVLAVARVLFVPAVAAFSLFVSLSAMQSLGSDSVRPLLLTSVSGRGLLIGKLLFVLSQQWLLLLFLFLPVAGYALGAGTPLFLVAFVLAALPVLVLAAAIGLSLGYLFWLVTERLGIGEGIHRLLAGTLSIGIFAILFLALNADLGDVPLATLAERDPRLPVAYYVDLLFVGSPFAEPLSLRTAVAGALVLGAIPLAVVALVRLAPAYWYGTPEPSGESASKPRGSATVDRPPSSTIGRTAPGLERSRTLRAALGYARDAVRRPGQFFYALNYLFFMAAGTVVAASDASVSAVPLVLGAGLAVLGGVLGAVFCLNPLAHEEAMLPELTLSSRPPETFVTARVLVGVLVSLPLAVLGFALIVVVGPGVAPGTLAVGTVLGLAALVANVCVAVGVGAAFPKFETTEVFNTETLGPSTYAKILHSGAMLALGGAAAGTAYAVGASDSPLSTVERVGLLASVVLVFGAAIDGGRRYAVAVYRCYGKRVRPDRAFTVYAAFGLALVAYLFGQAFVLIAALGRATASPAVSLLLEYLGFAVVAGVFLYATARGTAYLDIRAVTLRDGVVIVAGLLVSLAIGVGGTTLLSAVDLPGIDETLFNPAAEDTGTLPLGQVVITTLFMLAVVGPVEELLFRNVIQKYLCEWYATPAAVVIASVVFVLVHLPVYYLGTGNLAATGLLLSVLFVVSCLWGTIYARTRSLPVVALVHGLYNVGLVWLVYIGGSL